MIILARRKKKRVINSKKVIIFLTVCTIVILAIYYVITMPIKNIYIKNNVIVTDNEIIKLAELEEYPSFLLTKKTDLIRKIKKNKYIEDVQIRKEFGNIITIDIKEYQGIALTKNEEIILSNGIKIENKYELSDIPILINNIEKEKVYKNFAQKFEKIDKNILRQISEIEYSPTEVDEERFLLYMNDTNLVYITLTKIAKINKYNKIKDKIEGKKGTIYLDTGNYIELRG